MASIIPSPTNVGSSCVRLISTSAVPLLLADRLERIQQSLSIGFKLVQKRLEPLLIDALEEEILTPFRIGARFLENLSTLPGQRHPLGTGVLGIGSSFHKVLRFQVMQGTADPGLVHQGPSDDLDHRQ